MNSEEARQRAEKSFKQEEPRHDVEAQAVAIRRKTEHLKALRLAKEPQLKNSNHDR